MHKKTNLYDLDIPEDDVECWNRYSKHQWVYDLSRLLDAQGIKWSPFECQGLDKRIINMQIYAAGKGIVSESGYLYKKHSEGHRAITEVFIIKGEIKHL